MREIIQARLDELKKELSLGQAELQALDTKQLRLRETMLRITGAVTVLEELLEKCPKENSDGDKTVPS